VVGTETEEGGGVGSGHEVAAPVRDGGIWMKRRSDGTYPGRYYPPDLQSEGRELEMPHDKVFALSKERKKHINPKGNLCLLSNTGTLGFRVEISQETVYFTENI
jgi:hypothetical protein